MSIKISAVDYDCLVLFFYHQLFASYHVTEVCANMLCFMSRSQMTEEQNSSTLRQFRLYLL